MTGTHRAISERELLEHLGWVRGLAMRLVGDLEQAHDVTQEVCRAALETPPRLCSSGPGLRAWLRSATRFLAGKALRNQRRRSAREILAARYEAAPSTLDVVSRNALIQRVSQAVMALNEPYRSTILYRYLDGEPSGDIAIKMDIPAATVRKRLSRGLALLRTRLEQQGIDGSSLSALVALPAHGGLATAKLSAIGGIGIMFSKATALSGAAVLTGSGLLWLAMASPGASPAQDTTATASADELSALRTQHRKLQTAYDELRRDLDSARQHNPGSPDLTASRNPIEDPGTLLASSRRADQAHGIELLAEDGSRQSIRQLLELYLATDDPILIAMLEEALLASGLDITRELLTAFQFSADPTRADRFADMLLRLAEQRPELRAAVQSLFVDTLRALDANDLQRTAARNALLQMGPGVIEPVAAIITDPVTADGSAGAAAWLLMQLGDEHAGAVQAQLDRSLNAVLAQLASGLLLEDQSKGMEKKLQWLSWVAANRPTGEHDGLVGLFVDALGRARNEGEAMPIAWGIANVQGVSADHALTVADALLESMMRNPHPDVRRSHAWAIHLLASGYGDSRIGPTFYAIRDLTRALQDHNGDPVYRADLTWLLEQLAESERRARR